MCFERVHITLVMPGLESVRRGSRVFVVRALSGLKSGMRMWNCEPLPSVDSTQIWVESTLGKGSQFHIRIPDFKPDSARTTNTREPRRTDSNPGITKVM